MKETMFDLSGKVALVTGGSRGLGKEMARGLAAAGADLLICSRYDEELKATRDQLRQEAKGSVECIAVDLSRRESVQTLGDRALERMGRVDILVNNAGTNLPQPIDKIKDETWDYILELNLSSCMALTRVLVPGMKERRWGRIIHISSIMAIASREGRSSYSATKAALVGLTRASALDLGSFNITVNCIAPGFFETDLTEELISDDLRKVIAGRAALGRWGKPEELIGPVLLLASEAGSYITGSVLLVDGGILSRAS